MKNFLSIKDVSDLNGLVQQALDFKTDPFSKKQLGAGRPWV